MLFNCTTQPALCRAPRAAGDVRARVPLRATLTPEDWLFSVCSCRIATAPPKPTVSALTATQSLRVEARWRGGMRWYPGVIAKTNTDGTYDVLYDDGDTEYHLDKARIRILPEQTAEPTPRPPIESTCLGCAMNNIFQ